MTSFVEEKEAQEEEHLKSSLNKSSFFMPFTESYLASLLYLYLLNTMCRTHQKYIKINFNEAKEILPM